MMGIEGRLWNRGAETREPVLEFTDIWILCAAIAFTTAFTTPAQAGLNEWTPIGPPSDGATDLAVDPQNPEILYTATGRELYKSVDGAESWTRLLDQDGAKIPATVLAADDSTPGAIYAGTEGRGLYRSFDAGVSWTVFAEAPDESVREILVDRHNASVLYAATESGLFRSSNQGADWAEVAAFGRRVRDVEVAVTPGVVYVAAFGSGLERSTDYGVTWTSITGPSDDSIWGLAAHPEFREVLYLTSSEGVFKTENSGESWNLLKPGWGIGGAWDHLLVDPREPERLYGADELYAHGLYRSRDGGSSWSDGEEIRSRHFSRLVTAGDDATVYAATADGGVYRSDDFGFTWRLVSGDLQGGWVGQILVHPENPAQIFTTTGAGLFRSDDFGATWKDLTSTLPYREEPFPGDDVTFLWVDPRRPEKIFLAGRRGGLRSSEDAGETWEFLRHPFQTQLNVLVADPEDPSILYLGLGDFGILRSDNFGRQWTSISRPPMIPGPPSAQSIAIHPNDSREVLVASGKEIYRSPDRGLNWELINEVSFGIRSLVYDVHAPDTYFAYGATSGIRGIYRSHDRGATWKLVLETPRRLSQHTRSGSLIVDPATPGKIYAGLEDGVYVSHDGGDIWQRIHSESLDDGSIRTIARTLVLDPNTPSTLYVGTEERGLLTLQDVAQRKELVLHGGRMKAEVEWVVDGATGLADVAVVEPASLETPSASLALRSEDSAVIEFFTADNWEMLLKVLDGTSYNGHYWVYLTAATDVGYSVEVTDTSCGTMRVYENEVGRPAEAVSDHQAFRECAQPAPPSCQEGPETLCLGENGRFRAKVRWTDSKGGEGFGRQSVLERAGLAKSLESGVMTFFSPNNWEVLLKVLDGCAINDHYWVFGAAATEAQFTLRVTDLPSGEVWTHENPPDELGGAFFDTRAFVCR